MTMQAEATAIFGPFWGDPDVPTTATEERTVGDVDLEARIELLVSTLAGTLAGDPYLHEACIWIRYNNAATNDPCAFCGQRTDPECGPELFAAESYSLVCRDCARQHAPRLLAVRDLLHELACAVLPEGALDSPSGASRRGGHEPLPSVVSQYDGLSAQHLRRGRAPGGYDTCNPGCPGCEKS